VSLKTIDLEREIYRTDEVDDYRYEGTMTVDGKLVAKDHGYTYYEVAEKQRAYAEWRGWV
jgi:hypothetical protein